MDTINVTKRKWEHNGRYNKWENKIKWDDKWKFFQLGYGKFQKKIIKIAATKLILNEVEHGVNPTITYNTSAILEKRNSSEKILNQIYIYII